MHPILLSVHTIPPCAHYTTLSCKLQVKIDYFMEKILHSLLLFSDFTLYPSRKNVFNSKTDCFVPDDLFDDLCARVLNRIIIVFVLNQITIAFPTKLFFTESRAEMPGFPLYQQFWREFQVWSVGLSAGIKNLPPFMGREFFYTCVFRF